MRKVLAAAVLGSLLMLAGPASAASLVWTFDDGFQGWEATNDSIVATHDAATGEVVWTFQERSSGNFDPIFRIAGQSIDSTQYTHMIMHVTATGLANDPQTSGFFFWNPAGHGRVGFDTPDGESTIVINPITATSGNGTWTETINQLRFDIPDNDANWQGLVDRNAEVRLDWVVLTDTPDDYDGDGLTNAEEDGLGTSPFDSDSDNDGLGDAAEVNTHNTDPNNSDTDGDGVNDGTEVTYGSDPLDANDTVVLPVSTPLALMLLALVMALAGSALVVRKRTA